MAKRTSLPTHEKITLENWLKENINNPIFAIFRKDCPDVIISHNTFERYRDRIKTELRLNENDKNTEVKDIEDKPETPTKRYYTPRQTSIKNTFQLYQTIGVINLNDPEITNNLPGYLINLVNEFCKTNLQLIKLADGTTEIRRVQK